MNYHPLLHSDHHACSPGPESGKPPANIMSFNQARACSVTKTMNHYSRTFPQYLAVAGLNKYSAAPSLCGSDQNRHQNPVNSALDKFSNIIPSRKPILYTPTNEQRLHSSGNREENLQPSDDEQGEYILGEDDLLSGIGDDVGNCVEHAPKCPCEVCSKSRANESDDYGSSDAVQPPATINEVNPRKTFNFMYQLYLSKQMCDLVVKLGECEFWLHKMALIEHSDKYYNMFCGKDNEAVSEIHLYDTTPEAVRIALDYLYTNQANLRVDNVEDVLQCALQMDVPDLVEQCVTFVKNSSARPSLRSLAEVRRYGFGEQLLELVSRDFKELSNSAEFLQLDVEEVSALLSENSLQVDREVDVFLAAVRWLLHNHAERQIYTVRVLENVRFGLMFPSELVSVVEAQTQLMKIAEVRQMLYDAYKYYALLLSKSYLVGQLPNPQPRGSKKTRSGAGGACDTMISCGKTTQLPCSVPKKKCLTIHSLQPCTMSSPIKGNIPECESTYVSPRCFSSSSHQDARYTMCGLRSTHTQTVQQCTSSSACSPPSPSACSRKSCPVSTRVVLVNDSWENGCSPKPTSCKADNPIPLAPPPPCSRHLLVIGGTDLICCNPDFPGRQVLCLRKDLTQWQPLAVLPVPRNNHRAIAIDNTVYILGGALPICETDEVFAEPTANVIGFDASACEWLVCQPMHEARLYFAAAASHGKIYIFGGQGKGNSVLSSVECYDPVYDRWDCRKPLARGAVGAVAAEYRDHIYLVGGYAWQEGEANTLKTVWKYDVMCDNWIELQPLCRGLCYAALVEVDDRLYLLGGAEKGCSDDQPLISVATIMVYDFCNDSWTNMGSLRIPRHDAGAAAIGSKIYVAGGLTHCNKPLKSVECYDTQHGVVLARIPNLPCPTTGCSCCTVYTELDPEDE